MTVLSLLRAGSFSKALAKVLNQSEKPQAQAIVRSLKTSSAKKGGGHGPLSLNILPSRHAWHQYKDQLHFYIFLGVIPLTALVFYANVFIGPATLSEIPEGYEPKQWEYFRHPISRFMAQHLVENQQELYERNMHYYYELDQRRRMRLLAKKVETLMQDRGDYPNYFTTRTNVGQYARNMQVERNYIATTEGND